MLMKRKLRKQGVKFPVFKINSKKLTKKYADELIYKFSCPAIQKEGKKVYIDEDLCWGCGVCAQLCPKGVITVVKK